MATFRKNKAGNWVVFGSVNEVSVGRVKVNRKDGSVRNVAVVSLGRPFSANGVTMVYGYLKESENDEKPAPVEESAPTLWGSPVTGSPMVSEDGDVMF